MEISHTSNVGQYNDPVYNGFLDRIQARFHGNVGDGPIFQTDAAGLFDAYLDGFTADRQHHTCHACRRFLETYGGLVTIDSNGGIKPAFWDMDDVPEHYKPSIQAVLDRIKKAKVTGVFLSKEKIWGQPVTGVWHHYAVAPPDSAIYRHSLLTAGQMMAEKLQDFGTVIRALEEFTLPMLQQAMTLLRSESLYRSEKVIGPAQWLHDLQADVSGWKGSIRSNLIWRAVATAPAGFCHPRSSMVGSLLEDIAAGFSFPTVSKRFAEKMNPLLYQRPQAAPSAGNIAQAEKIVEQLGIARSLERRYARLNEIQAIWTPKPKPVAPSGGGVFSHLVPKGEATLPPLSVPPSSITWEKFSRTVLPNVETMEFYVPVGANSFTALVTAVHADAPPILQWDHAEERNPVSWYLYSGGSLPFQWGLSPNRFCRVSAITLKPSMWGAKTYDHQGKGVILILEGAKDTRNTTSALFPETLKSELHAVRSTIEAHSRSSTLAGSEEATANGIMLANGSNFNPDWNALVRVKIGGTQADYRLDRWD